MGKTAADFKEGRVELYRDRIEKSISDGYPARGWIADVKPPWPNTLYSAGSLSRCVDVNHPYFHSMMRGRKAYKHLRGLDIGGPLVIERSSLTMPTTVDIVKPFFSTLRGVEGVYAPMVTYLVAMGNTSKGSLPSLSSDLGISRADLRTLGSTAIARSLPDVPQFSLFRFVGELRAGLPKIPLSALAKEKKLRNAGGEYLNVQFGILPTVKDLENLIKVLSNPALRSAVKRTLDEEHRVRKVLDKGSTYSKRSLTSSEMNTIPNLSGNSGYVISRSEYRIWSSISFVYYQATLLDQLIAELDEKLGGIGALPKFIDLWNLTPWSWLVDWFVNFNHVITNLSFLGRDGLNMQRGYLMASYSTTEESYQIGSILGELRSTSGILKQERKYRIAASPFGFGYTWKDFDPFQLSILGALGVSRMRF